MAIENATFVKLKIATKELIGEVSHSFNSSVDVIDISSKAGGRTRSLLPGKVTENISFESMADDSNGTDYGYSDAHTAMKAGTSVAFSIIRVDTANAQVNPSLQQSGNGYITSLTRNAPYNDKATFSGTIEVSGDTTNSTYSG